jgi:tetratricopeptide (TPR) repeat protein
MKTFAACVCLALAAAQGAGQTRPAPAETGPSHAAVAVAPSAADSLLHSAVGLVHAPADTPGRAGRLVVLLEAAVRLNPDDPATCRLLADVQESRGRTAEAAAALETCRAARGRPCYTTDCRWLALLLDQRKTAEQRIALLEGLLNRTDLPAGVRAVAAARLGGLHRGRGELDEAHRAYRRALELDPANPDAAEGLLAVTEDPAPADRTAALLQLLRGNPKAVAVAWDLAALLDALGLHAESLTFYEHAWQTATSTGGAEALSSAFVTEYCNAMLNAERYAEALRRFRPLLEQFPDNLDLRALCVEAYRAVGQRDDAEAVLQSMVDRYETRAATDGDSALLVAERAWFNLITRRHARTALAYAQRAAEMQGEDDFVRRVLAACRVRTGQFQAGLDVLKELRDRDVYAAVFLAEALFQLGEADPAAEALRSAVQQSRSGPAYRRAGELAEQYEVSLPPAPGADGAAEVVAEAELGALAMGRSPERYVAVELRAAAPAVEVGEPLEVTATLTNVGDRSVPIGEWGLLTPTMSFEVAVGDRRLSKLPLLSWASPRHIEPGNSVTATCRLDVAELDTLLARRPLDDVSLTVRPTLDPVTGPDGEVVSALPQVQVAPVSITRTGLIRPDDRDSVRLWQQGFEQLMDRLGERLATGTVEQRMLAARRVGALLSAGKAAARGEVTVPPAMRGRLSDEPVLALLERALGDDLPAVRAEMLKALLDCPLDESILHRLGRVFDDPDPLVRMRAAELLGASDTPDKQTPLRFLASDSEELVRRMAELFLAPSR